MHQYKEFSTKVNIEAAGGRKSLATQAAGGCRVVVFTQAYYPTQWLCFLFFFSSTEEIYSLGTALWFQRTYSFCVTFLSAVPRMFH